MLVYPDYPTSLSKLSLNKKLQKGYGYEMCKTFVNLTLLKIN